MIAKLQTWVSLALRPSVVRRALIAAAIVGSLQIAINHGDHLLVGDVDARRVVKMILTSMVPYMVSTLSSVGAIRNQQKGLE